MWGISMKNRLLLLSLCVVSNFFAAGSEKKFDRAATFPSAHAAGAFDANQVRGASKGFYASKGVRAAVDQFEKQKKEQNLKGFLKGERKESMNSVNSVDSKFSLSDVPLTKNVSEVGKAKVVHRNYTTGQKTKLTTTRGLKRLEGNKKTLRKSSFGAGVTLDDLTKNADKVVEQLKGRRLTRSLSASLLNDSLDSNPEVDLVETVRPTTGGKLVYTDAEGKKTRLTGRRARLEPLKKEAIAVIEGIRQIEKKKAAAVKALRAAKQAKKEDAQKTFLASLRSYNLI